MVRFFVFACAALSILLGFMGPSNGGAAKVKNHWVKGTLKSIDSSKDVLVVNQRIKNAPPDQELTVLPTTEFSLVFGNETKTGTGNIGLRFLQNKSGVLVAVFCDKNFNALKVVVKTK